MSAQSKMNLYLVHQETGQRYPIQSEVLIGRALGDILFRDDDKLSATHCRLVITPQGLAVHDLGSHNGTFIDSMRLDPKKVYALTTRSLLIVGRQEFRLQEVSIERKKKSVPAKQKEGFDYVTILGVLVLLCGLAVLANMYWQTKNTKRAQLGKMISPMDMVEKEMKAAFADYAQVGEAHTAGRIKDKDLAYSIKNILLPQLKAARVKMDVLRPQTEWERRKIVANRKLVSALINQVTALANFAETRDPKHAKALEQWSAVAARFNEDVQKLDAQRTPSAFKY